jgi:hypothetical protein
MLSGSIGPQEQPLGNGRFVVYGESARNGVLSVHFNPPVQEGSIESLTRQQFSICTDLKAIPNKLDWVKKQIEKLKAKQHCELQLPDYIHHLFFTHLCCKRFPEEAQKYLTTWQIQDCKALALEALSLACAHYGINAKDLMDDIYNPESALWNQLSLVIEKESDSQPVVRDNTEPNNEPRARKRKKQIRKLLGYEPRQMTNAVKQGFHGLKDEGGQWCSLPVDVLRNMEMAKSSTK